METLRNGLTYLRELAIDQPFSQRLNNWIIENAEGLNYVAGAYTEESFEDWKQHVENLGGYLPISNEHCEVNIFGSPEVNIMFRAWHDSIHLQLNEGFDYMGEVRVAFAQCAELPLDWLFERQLIMAEVVAQAAHHEKTGNFVSNQRQFTIEVLIAGRI